MQGGVIIVQVLLLSKSGAACSDLEVNSAPRVLYTHPDLAGYLYQTRIHTDFKAVAKKHTRVWFRLGVDHLYDLATYREALS